MKYNNIQQYFVKIEKKFYVLKNLIFINFIA